MPQRVIGIIVAVAGLLFVLGLVLLRFNLRKAARTGPRWKRNLVLAGIFVLASFGLVAATSSEVGCVTMCYEIAPVGIAERSMERLSQRLSLLEKFAASEKIDREVVEKILSEVEGDIDTLKNNRELLSNSEQAMALELRMRAERHVLRIKARLAEENIRR